jgi:hypothetical protein
MMLRPWKRMKEWSFTSTIRDSVLDGGEWSASYTGRFTPGTHWIRGWLGPRAALKGVEWRKIFFPQPGIETQTSSPQPVAIPTDLSQFSVQQNITCSIDTPSVNELWNNTEWRIRNKKKLLLIPMDCGFNFAGNCSLTFWYNVCVDPCGTCLCVSWLGKLFGPLPYHSEPSLSWSSDQVQRLRVFRQ